MTTLLTGLKCVRCGVIFKEGEAATCPYCGMDEGILDAQFDLNKAAETLTRANLAARPLNHWRYAELLPVEAPESARPQAIGWTPMIEAPRLASALGIGRLRLKDDGRSASASFKDRASSIGVTRALAEDARVIACASTGNAASSLAHCAASAGLPAFIFVSQRIPEGKLVQLLAYGAYVFRVRGTYDEAWRLCQHCCGEFGWYNRNAAVNPYLIEGKKTGGLEIAEQCADDPPDWVSASVGDGCSIAGVAKGLRQMREIGFVDWSAQVLGVQAEGVAPIARAFETGKFSLDGSTATYADSIDCPVPRNWRKAVEGVSASDGRYVTVSDGEIMEAVRETGRLAGIFAEPAAAAAVAGIAAARRQGILNDNSNVVAIISGNGLKDLGGATQAVGKPFDLDPTENAVRDILHEIGEDS